VTWRFRMPVTLVLKPYWYCRESVRFCILSIPERRA